MKWFCLFHMGFIIIIWTMSMYRRSLLGEEGYKISSGNEKIVIGNGKSRSISFLYWDCPFLESQHLSLTLRSFTKVWSNSFESGERSRKTEENDAGNGLFHYYGFPPFLHQNSSLRFSIPGNNIRSIWNENSFKGCEKEMRWESSPGTFSTKFIDRFSSLKLFQVSIG